MPPMSKKKKRNLVVAVLVAISYGSFLVFLSLADLAVNRTYIQPQRILFSDGSRLIVWIREPKQTFHNIYYQRTPTIEGTIVTAFVANNTVTIQIGTKTYEHKGVSIFELCWSQPYESAYFIEGIDKYGSAGSHIWRWNRTSGFTRLTSQTRLFYSLSLSMDERTLCAMEYRYNTKAKANFLYTCSALGGSERNYKYGAVNFRPVMLSEDDFLIEGEDINLTPGLIPTQTHVYRWKPSTSRSVPYEIDGHWVRSVQTINNTLWALLQEPSYRWYPWIVKRVDDQVTVARVGANLTTFNEQIPFHGD